MNDSVEVHSVETDAVEAKGAAESCNYAIPFDDKSSEKGMLKFFFDIMEKCKLMAMALHNMPSFKSNTNKLDLISLSSQPYTFFSLPLLGLGIGHHRLSPT